MRQTAIMIGGCFALALSSHAHAQITTIDLVHGFSWSENVGWLNWRDANGGSQGVAVHATFLSGFIWSENTGWINTGDGSPGGGVHYTNSDSSDFGVNIDGSTGDLFGFAWGENIGWVNFDTRASLTSSGDQARLDRSSRRFRGYAWGENIGWINLDDNTHFVAMRCLADWNGDQIHNTSDFVAFLNDFNAAMSGQPVQFGDPDVGAPFGVLNTADFVAFLNGFSEGCP